MAEPSRTQSAYQSEPRVSGRACCPEGGVAVQRSAYRWELLMRGQEELSFEELLAERYKQQREADEKRKHLEEEKEMQQKRRLIELLTNQSAAEITVGLSSGRNSAASPNELQGNVLLHPDERSLCVQVRFPRQPGVVDSSEPSRLRSTASPVQTLVPSSPSVFSVSSKTSSEITNPVQSGLQNTEPDSAAPFRSGDGQRRPATEELWTRPDSRPPMVSQNLTSKPRQELSPIQETSIEARYISFMGGLSAENGCPLHQDQQESDQSSSGSGAGDPCDPDVRQRILDLCDITSSPDFHSEPRPLPDIEEHSFLHLGGQVVHVFSRVLNRGRWSIFQGVTNNQYALLKVDSCSAPWDFYLFHRLKKSPSCPEGLPLIGCFLYLDGCISIYMPPQDHLLIELMGSVSSELVGCKVMGLLRLVSQLHSCGLLHTALQPDILACYLPSFQESGWVFPMDWSSSVDLDLHRDIMAVQNLLSAQNYISLGLLEPTAPPHLVDLMGVAETVHLILTSSRMVPVKDATGWTAEHFSGDEPCDLYTRMWRRFFRSLLNASGRSSLSVLSELKAELSGLFP